MANLHQIAHVVTCLEAKIIYWLLSCIFAGLVLSTFISPDITREMRLRRPPVARSSRSSIRYVQMKRKGGK